MARNHCLRRVMMARRPCSCHVAILSSSVFVRVPFFLTRFSRAVLEAFWFSKWSYSISSKISRRLLSNGITFARIGVRTRELWLPEVRVPELFLCVFPAKIPIKRGMLPANREFHVVAEVIIFPTRPEGACPEEKCIKSSAHFSTLFVCVCARI